MAHEPTVQVLVDPPIKVLIESHEGSPGPIGSPGPAGPIGPAGPAGTGGDIAVVHNQLTPATTWSISHNLNKYPSVTTVDSAGSLVHGEVSYVNINTLTVTFSLPFGGSAYLN